MDEAIQFLMEHAYALLFWLVLLEQIGLPIPSVPLLLAAGALAGAGTMDFAFASGLAIIAALTADLFWYYRGRYRGGRVLNLLCRISLEPESCARRTETMFARHGAYSLLIAKFVPGLNTAAPPLAGVFRMPLSRFMLFDGLGALFWVAAFAGLGYVFSEQLEQIAVHFLRWGSGLAVVVVGSLAAYMLWRYIQRQRFLRNLRIARISPGELMDRLAAGDALMIVALRQPLDVEAFPYMIAGALRLSLEEVEHRHAETPRDRDVVLYCS